MNKNFFMVSNNIFDYGLSPAQLAVYCCLVRHRNTVSGDCFPSRKRLAELCGVSLSTVDRAVRHLCKLGLISKHADYYENGTQRSNRYDITAL